MQDGISSIVNGVSVVTSKSGGIVNGLSVAWMSQVSVNPPLVMVAIGHSKYTHELIEKSNAFAVNILSGQQMDLAKHFGLQSGRKANKFKNVEYEIKNTGSPILKDCLAYLDCKLYKSLTAGDHTIFIGEVLDAGVKNEKSPLIFNTKDYF
jgi:flavin reductase (DIM6/NTAB) family NADH-FMN oxidoreductase RutF